MTYLSTPPVSMTHPAPRGGSVRVSRGKIVLIDINENLSQISSGLEIAPIDINENLSRVHSGSEMLTINFNKKLSKIHSYLEIFDFRF